MTKNRSWCDKVIDFLMGYSQPTENDEDAKAARLNKISSTYDDPDPPIDILGLSSSLSTPTKYLLEQKPITTPAKAPKTPKPRAKKTPIAHKPKKRL